MTFKEQYGPWAVIAGASQGIGRALALQVAAKGISCLLLSRRSEPLEELATEIREKHGVEVAVAAVDLSATDAPEALVAAVGDREVGLYVSNAGADPNGLRFLDQEPEKWTQLVNLNVLTPMRLAHHFGRLMKAKSRGGILLIGSGACYMGSSFTSVYSGAKAFELCFADGLWGELKPHGVDVLFCALGATDTPAFRDLLNRKGSPLLSNLADPADVATKALAKLPHGPVYNWGAEDEETGHAPMSAAARRARVLHIEEATKRIFGNG